MEEEEKVNFYPPQMGTGAEKDTKGEKKTWKNGTFFGVGLLRKNFFPCCESTRVLLSSFSLDLFTVFPLCFPFQVSASDRLALQTDAGRKGILWPRPTTWVSTGGGDRCLYFRGGGSLKFAGKSKVRRNGLGETRTKKLDVISSRPPTKNVLNFSFLLLKQSRGREREREEKEYLTGTPFPFFLFFGAVSFLSNPTLISQIIPLQLSFFPSPPILTHPTYARGDTCPCSQIASNLPVFRS